jgi:hypothetical protein
MKAKTTILIALLVALVGASGLAQTQLGSVVGTVTDEQGGALPGVAVTLAGPWARDHD